MVARMVESKDFRRHVPHVPLLYGQMKPDSAQANAQAEAEALKV